MTGLAGRRVLPLMAAAHQRRGDHEISGGPVAGNRDIADFMISSPLMGRSYQEWDLAPGQARHNQAALRVARAD